MRETVIRWLTGGAMFLLGTVLVCAAEPTVQDFEGWKITITPGDFPVAVETRDHVPPAPTSERASNVSLKEGTFKLVSLRQDAASESDAAQQGALAPAPAPTSAAGDSNMPIIVPGVYCDLEKNVAANPPAGRVDPQDLSQRYSEVYRSIPFNRSEYNANPSYIHDATMEFLFGQMRPTVIHRNTTTVNHHHTGYGFNGYAYPPVQAYIPGVGLRIHRTR